MSSRRVTGAWRTGQQKTADSVQTPQQTQAVDYYSANDDAVMEDVNNGVETGEKTTGYWKKKRAAEGGRIVKKKKDPNSVNKRLKKYVQPKNAAMCLNELVGNLKYTTEIEGGGGQATCVLVQVGGQDFRGYGSSKQLAKQAAAEAALVSFVKPPKDGSTRDEANASLFTGEESSEPDSTPWAVLASFAMFKLFNDWREGRVGMCASTTFAGMNMDTTSNPPGFPLPKAAPKVNPKVAAAKLEAAQKAASEAKAIPKPAKALPSKAAEMHPVMLLNQMRPSATFQTSTVKDISRVTAVIDGKAFKGEGTNMKKAKLQLAVSANADLFGVVTAWEGVQ